MKYLIAFLLLMPALGSAGGQPDGLAPLQSKLLGLNTFSANFEQRLIGINGDLIQLSTGNLQASKPNLLHWETSQPMEQLIIADGETLWLFDPDLDQVTTQAYTDELAKTPAMLLIGRTEQLSQEYDVFQNPDTHEFTLLAKSADNLYSKVSLSFDDEKPATMVLFDTLGQQTHIDFSNVILNVQLESDLFTFEPPSGVDVIRHE